MKINWIPRIKNKAFWLAIIPAIALLVQAILALFGVQVDPSETVKRLIDIVNAAFAVLVIIGVVTDPTTDGLSDSARAMTYGKPWADPAEDTTDDDGDPADSNG